MLVMQKKKTNEAVAQNTIDIGAEHKNHTVGRGST
jgi:hypothetical protein